MAKVLFIVANNWFQDTEFWVTYKTLTAQGHECKIASWKWWYCMGVFWKEIEESLKLDEVSASDYDLLVFVWWGWAENQYFNNETYLWLATEAKAVAAICIAPTILSYSWIFQWKWKNLFEVQRKFSQGDQADCRAEGWARRRGGKNPVRSVLNQFLFRRKPCHPKAESHEKHSDFESGECALSLWEGEPA